MITVVDALQLLEECAQEPDVVDTHELRHSQRLPSNRIVARALERGDLRRSDLTRYPLVHARRGDREGREQPPLTLGAFVAFRAADRLARAGASPDQTIEASYRAARRYVDLFPASLRDSADRLVPASSSATG
ncbi:MAG: hypothetical protein JWO63_1575 [Frankiales bacterium]|nr:hypothetical protein [Frankiales bacterium]